MNVKKSSIIVMPIIIKKVNLELSNRFKGYDEIRVF